MLRLDLTLREVKLLDTKCLLVFNEGLGNLNHSLFDLIAFENQLLQVSVASEAFTDEGRSEWGQTTSAQV
jgi:hypothetical protein